MTDSEKLDYLMENVGLIARETVGLKRDMAELKEDVTVLKEDVAELKADVTVLKKDVAELKTDVAVLKADVAELKADVTVLKEDVAELKTDTIVLKEKVAVLDRNVASIRIYQENVLEPNLKKVAEGHLDLSRKLREALQISDEEEILHMRVNVLESDMRRVKEKLALA